MVDGVNGNLNMAELYKLAKKADVNTGKTAGQTNVDSSMTRNGSVYNNAMNKTTSQNLADVESGLAAYKNNPNMTAEEKAELSKIEQRLNEVKQQTANGLQSTGTETSQSADGTAETDEEKQAQAEQAQKEVSKEEGEASAASAQADADSCSEQTDQTLEDQDTVNQYSEQTNKDTKS